jgi:hypothetical protein
VVVVVSILVAGATIWGMVQLAASSDSPRSTLQGVTELEEIGQLQFPPSTKAMQSRISEGQHLWVAARFTIDPFDLGAFIDDSHLPSPQWNAATVTNGEDLGLGWNADGQRVFRGTSDHLSNGVSRRVMVLLDDPNNPVVCVVIYRP